MRVMTFILCKNLLETNWHPPTYWRETTSQNYDAFCLPPREYRLSRLIYGCITRKIRNSLATSNIISVYLSHSLFHSHSLYISLYFPSNKSSTFIVSASKTKAIVIHTTSTIISLSIRNAMGIIYMPCKTRLSF